ncbi:hypothetical protein PUN28_004151 [Cardiocondyla obscurior]|uniref:Uncharacterized protein n=1 Tax=Cardiocondyla obscurior TaxID=286306 RepID=A0AAW2GPS9_9HYME
MYRDYAANSTRNIAKSTNVVLVCEKNNGSPSSLRRMPCVCTMKMQIREERACARVYTYIVCLVRVLRDARQTNDTHREQPSIKHPEIGYSCPPSRLYVIVVKLDGWMHV